MQVKARSIDFDYEAVGMEANGDESQGTRVELFVCVRKRSGDEKSAIICNVRQDHVEGTAERLVDCKHAYILPLYDVIWRGQTRSAVYERVGIPLTALLQHEDYGSYRDVIANTVVSMLNDALVYIHRVLHRGHGGVTLDNILVKDNGHCQLGE